MANSRTTVADRRKYLIKDVKSAKQIAREWLEEIELSHVVTFGLPEIDDRYHYWRVPLIREFGKLDIGEVVVDARTGFVVRNKSTRSDVLETRLLGRQENSKTRVIKASRNTYDLSSLRNVIALGDSEQVLHDLPAESIGLVFTSPPYFNARPEYTDYITYEEYLLKLRKVIQSSYRVLGEGRFFVINVSPVLVRRSSRAKASKRIAVPFDLHAIFIDEGFDFIDDIIWVKPEGAGWATGRGRRFAADRNPLQYKSVPVTEYVLVYRKHTDKLIDWNIRAHPNQKLVKDSRISGAYDKTNIWKIKPANDSRHPAIFPLELAKKVVTYYSFKQDVVLDPFAGIGTLGAAASQLGRRFVLIDVNPEYVEVMRAECRKWLGPAAKDILTVNCEPVDVEGVLI